MWVGKGERCGAAARLIDERVPAAGRAPFRKILFVEQDYPDNYVDSTFLSDLQRNVNVHPASLPTLLCQTLPITQHLASTFIFIGTFIRLHRGSLDPPRLLSLCALLIVLGWTWSRLVGGTSTVAPIIPLLTLYLLSPALKTLTRATTSDSIWALSGTLFAVNLFLGDYRSIPSADAPRAPAKLPSTLSLTAAISASTVLASRLASNLAVFSLLLFSTLWFGPFPLLRSALPAKPTIALTIALSVGAVYSLAGVGGGAAKIAAIMLVGTSVVAPLGRGWLMIRYKDRVRGPWDQAVPSVGAPGG
ncbi:hypothetical protein RQP46_004157 [Phenoliferia psychrophenolica]